LGWGDVRTVSESGSLEVWVSNISDGGVSQSDVSSFSFHGDHVSVLDGLDFLRSSKILIGNFLVNEAGLSNIKLVLELDVVVLDVSEVGNNSTESSVFLVSEAKSGFVITAESGKSRAFSSGGVKLSGKIINGGREIGVLVGEDHDLVLEVGNSCFSIGKSSLKRRAFSSKLVKLSGKVINGGREVGVLIGEDHNLVLKVSNSGLGVSKSSLELRALSSNSVKLSGKVVNCG